MHLHQTSGEAGTIDTLGQEPQVSGAEIMTVEECAQFTRTSISYWRKKIAAHALPILRLGTRTLLRKSDVLQYLESKVSPPDSEVYERARSITATMLVRKGAR